MTPTPTTSTNIVKVHSHPGMQHLNGILAHVFLPPLTPQHGRSINDEEYVLLRTFNETVQDNKDIYPDAAHAFSLWDALQENLDPGPVSDAIKNLLPGETLPVYLREQNCGLLLTALSCNEVGREEFVLSTFRASLPSETITSTYGDHAAIFPSASVTIPRSNIVESKSFVKQLQDLDQVDLLESVSLVKKSGQEIVEKREVADPSFCTKWLFGTLSDASTSNARLDEFPRIPKKIRDSVVWKEGCVTPWRRAPLWMVMKVTLQLLLERELGNVGKVVYKLIMLKFMVKLLRFSEVGSGDHQFDFLHMLAKIARRTKKLELLLNAENYSSDSNFILGFFDETIELTGRALKSTHDSLKKQLDLKITNSTVEVDLVDIKLWIHLSLKHSNFNELYLAQDNSTVGKFKKLKTLVVPVPIVPPRHRDNSLFFDIRTLDSNVTDLGVVLFDLEININFWHQKLGNTDGIYIWETFQQYRNLGSEFYKGDPVGSSRFILTLLKIIMAWDAIVVQKFPILAEHRPGINLNVIHNLLASSKADLVTIGSIEKYFSMRNDSAKYPSLIEEECPTVNSLSVRYATRDKSMQQVRSHILDWGKKKAEKKILEVQAARSMCERLEAEQRKLECEYVINEWKRRHSPSCQKCKLRTKERKMTVQIYEAPLPVGQELQLSVCFELLMPTSIAILRDILWLFAVECGSGKAPESELYGPWHSYAQIKSCNFRERDFKVQMMSTRKLHLDTHYKNLHPTNPDEDFVRANGYNCFYSGLGFIFDSSFDNEVSIAMKKRTTFKVEKKSRYAGMQWAIIGGTSQNEVIARQIECHLDLSLSEFIEYGSLRSDEQLQWRNLLRALNSRSLSLKEESVLHLICQQIWEVGEKGLKPYSFFRRHQRDFECEGFSDEILGVLETIRIVHVDNWKDNNVLLTIIFITQMVCILNKGPQVELGHVLLDKCRKDAVKWSKEIQRILSTLSSAPRAEVDALRVKLIEVNICVALSFGVDELHYYELITSGEFIQWLLALGTIHDNLVLLGDYKLKFSLKCLLRRIDEMGVLLEPFLCEAIRSGDLLTQFVMEHHAANFLHGAKDVKWMKYETEEQVYYTDVEKLGQCSRIQMDILKGRFLIDGSPAGYLPTTIENHKDFKRVFGGKSFEVQPYPFQVGRMLTRNIYEGSTYSFFLDHNGELIIVEHRKGPEGMEVELELVGEERFKKNIPWLLIENYTHWYNRKNGTFEFFNKEEKLSGKAKYILELENHKGESTRFLMDAANKDKVAVDVNCEGLNRIVQVLSRLEDRNWISLWCTFTLRNDRLYTADMPRMGLQFSLRNVGNGARHLQLICKEYRGMTVCHKQGNLNTLIGLDSGLLLEDAARNSVSPMNSILLIPHGVVRQIEGEIWIDTTDIRAPPFFAYEVDARLRQLKATGESRCANLWLAYLHAVTSKGTDSFTGVSGIERALDILQSGVCFSSEPIDDESFKTLKMIKELAPVRRYYPPGLEQMETYDEPRLGLGNGYVSKGMDKFLLLVDKLLDDSVRLQFLHPNHFSNYHQHEEECKRERYLAKRAYFRDTHYLSTEGGRLRGEFLPPLNKTEEFFEGRTRGDEWDERLQGVMELSQCVHSWTVIKKPKKVKSLLRSLLMNGKDLKGIILQEGGFPIKDGVYVWSRIDFRDYFLDLYNLARTRLKELRAEWGFLLTYFAFRKDHIGMDLLRTLQVIAVYWDQFSKVDPPPYSEYSFTDELFSSEKVLAILYSNKRAWESYLDRNKDEMKEYETELEFVDRMKPIHEELVKEQCDKGVELINKYWSTIGFDEKDSVDMIPELPTTLTEIELMGACMELNIKLKNWQRNKHLLEFIEQVETIVHTIISDEKFPKSDVKDVSKALNRVYMKKELREWCNRPRFTVNLESFILEKKYRLSQSALYEEVRNLFNVGKNIGDGRKAKTSLGTSVPFPLKIEENCNVIKEYMKDLEDSWTICHSTQEKKLTEINQSIINYYSTELRKWKTASAQYFQQIRELFIPIGKDSLKGTNLCLISAELYPRILPITMLKLLLEKDFEKKGEFFNFLRTLIGAYGVSITLEQRAARCLRYAKEKKTVEFNAEISNVGHLNWCPAERPAWLIFEIEMDLMIRPIQAKVADRMINPLHKKNSVIQLNMGEGKTAVIVPLLCLTLADNKALCRVTVLKSLYQMNRTSLSSRIGSVLLDRRLYAFPMRRDYKAGVAESDLLLDVYKECASLGGVVMTLPEHRLSFELKAYERTHADRCEEAEALFKVQDWLKHNVRDVLDESDEILHVKYQLIYTLGKQMPVGGGCLRWTVIMQLLQLVPEQVRKFHEGFQGLGVVEYKCRGSGKFPYCRILKDKEIGKDFCRNIALEILEGCSVRLPDIPGGEKGKKQVLDFLLEDQLNREGLNSVLEMFDENIQETLLILRGLLACGVLVTSLGKRWRVNFGVSSAEGYRRMAVPFRFKDVASERTEFGHPDVAILLTLLSYYYAGLSDDELEHCFVILYKEPNPTQEYRKWIDLLPRDYPNREKISALSSVNLNDFFQKTEVLFPALKFNVNVMNFWLGRVVFPHESKQFQWKIGCSPWDLCPSGTTITTGFSGTNDSKILLPKTIEQRDLDELKGTNGSVLRNLLLPENNRYQVLESCVSGLAILRKLADRNIRVLLDVGALMLELDNTQVAKEWLQLLDDKQIEVDAAVYFEDDKLVVLTKGVEGVVPFELSTFRNRLDRCVIYLDDVHTRGTDLKIPEGNTGCVTLGKGVTKDKLVQGCMRMRKLGQGHFVEFWASKEVDGSIRQDILSGQSPVEKIGTREVILWTIRNNQQQVIDGFIHWASSGVYQAQKLSSLAIYKSSIKSRDDLKLLAQNCSQKEQVDLKAMYGDVRTMHKFPVIVGHLLNRVNREIGKLIKKKSGLQINCQEIVDFFGKSVVDHSNKYVGDLLRSTQLLDEEQERELEHELEAQNEKQLPAAAKACINDSTEGVKNFIMYGSLQGVETWALKLPLALKNTRIWPIYPDDGWGKNIYCSRDFCEVVQPNGGRKKMDEYLRPLQWFTSVKIKSATSGNLYDYKQVVLILSGFEVEKYLDLFRSGKTKAVLHMYAPNINESSQESLHLSSNLVLPRRVETNLRAGDGANSLEVQLILGDVDLDWRLDVPLKIFSGGVYFSTKDEQEAYIRYVGLCPKPRTNDEQKLVTEGGLKDGWVKKEFSAKFGVEAVFKENPQGMIRAIAMCRSGGFFSMDSHVGKVLFGGSRPLP